MWYSAGVFSQTLEHGYSMIEVRQKQSNKASRKELKCKEVYSGHKKILTA